MSYLWRAGVGLLIGYTWWKFPAQLQTIKDRRARRIRTEIDRIRGGISPDMFVPNTPPRPTWRMRLTEYWADFEVRTRPRTPEQVAFAVTMAMTKDLHARKDSRSNRSRVV